MNRKLPILKKKSSVYRWSYAQDNLTSSIGSQGERGGNKSTGISSHRTSLMSDSEPFQSQKDTFALPEVRRQTLIVDELPALRKRNEPRKDFIPWQGWFSYRTKKKARRHTFSLTASLPLSNETWMQGWFEIDRKSGCMTWYRSPDRDDPRNTILGSVDLVEAKYNTETRKCSAKDKAPRFRIEVVDRRKISFWFGFMTETERDGHVKAWSKVVCGTPLLEQLNNWQAMNREYLYTDEDDLLTDHGIDYFDIKLELPGKKDVKISSLINPMGTVFLLLRHLLLCKSSIFYYWTPETVANIQTASKQGYVLHPLKYLPGDAFQLGGLFLINPRGILWRFNEQFAGDQPDYDIFMKACRENYRLLSSQNQIAPYPELDPEHVLREAQIVAEIKQSPELPWARYIATLTGQALYLAPVRKAQEQTKKDKKAWRCINLRSAQVLPYSLLKVIPEPYQQHKYTFRILTKDVEFILAFRSESESENWFDFVTFLSGGESLGMTQNTLQIEEHLRKANFYINPTHLDFEHSEIVGGGASGSVSKVMWLSSVQTAVKLLKNPELGDESELFYDEVMLLSGLRHPNIMTMYGISRFHGTVCLVTEYVPQGSLETAFDNPEEYPTNPIHSLALLKEISKGLIYLHKQGIIHRDIKPANILIDDWSNSRVKICDFGISRRVSKKNRVASNSLEETAFGSPTYTAPEAGGQTFTDRVDVFSFSIVMYELTVGPVWPDEQFGSRVQERYEAGTASYSRQLSL